MWFLILLLVGLSFAQQCRPPLQFYQDRERGWFWKEYCEPEKQKGREKEKKGPEEKILKKNKVDIPWHIIDKLDPQEISRIEEESRKIAIMYPTIENVSEYRKLLTYISNKAEKFAFQYYTAGRIMPLSRQPMVYESARVIQHEERIRKIKEIYRNFKNRAGIVVIVQRECPYCRAFKGVLELFRQESGWQVREVEIGENPVLAENLGTQTVPDIFLVLQRGGRYEWQRIGSGYMTLDDLVSGVMLGLYYLGEVKDATLISW